MSKVESVDISSTFDNQSEVARLRSWVEMTCFNDLNPLNSLA